MNAIYPRFSLCFPLILLTALSQPFLLSAQSGKPGVTRAGSAKALTNMNFDKPDSVLVTLPKGNAIAFVSYVKLKRNKNLKETRDVLFSKDSRMRKKYPYNLTQFQDANGKIISLHPLPDSIRAFFSFTQIPDSNIQQLNDTSWQVNFKYHPGYDRQAARLKHTYYNPDRLAPFRRKVAGYRVEKEADFLQPYSRYIMIMGISSDESVEVFSSLHDFYNDPFLNWYDLLKAYSQYKSMVAHERKVLDGMNFLPSFASCLSFFSDKLQPKYISIDQRRSDIQAQALAVQPSIGFLRNSSGLARLNSSLRDQQTANLASTGITRDSLSFLFNLIGKLNEADNKYFDKIFSGEVSLTDQASLKPATGLSDKIQNLQASLTALNKLHIYMNAYTLTYLQVASPATLDLQHLKDNLAQVETALLSIQEDSKKINSAKEDIADALKKNTAFSSVSLNYVTSFVQDLQTRGALSLAPDFGVISYGFIPLHGNQKFTGVTPYLGVQINWRPFDKNIPLSSLPASYRKWYMPIRWSAMLGITFVSVKEAGKRDNLFSGTNLLVGIGYKLTSEIRLIGGAMLFKKYDLNYLSSDTRLAATPYAGVSIDLDLKKFFSSITDVFIGK